MDLQNICKEKDKSHIISATSLVLLGHFSNNPSKNDYQPDYPKVIKGW